LADIEYRSFELKDVVAVKEFTDRWIGMNYYSVTELELIQEQSCNKQMNASLLAFSSGRLIGVRLSLAPGSWLSTNLKISPELWQAEKNEVAYFKSLFIHENYRRLGLGKEMSLKSQEILAKMGAKAILTHSWLESPKNSSQEYLLKYNFKELVRYQKFWNHINYLCTRCAPRACECTAVEMIKYIID
jgi:hypothetical protein